MNKFAIVLSLLVLLLVVTSGCSAVGLVAENATNTPTRTPRPTFTPRPSATEPATAVPTQAATNTPTAPAATDTPEAAAPTNTPKPVVVRTKAPVAPPQPTKPPAPSYSVSVENTVRCDSTTYTIYVILKQVGGAPRHFAGGYTMMLFAGGQPAKNGAGQVLSFVTEPDQNAEASFVGNCHRPASTASPLPYNGKLDASDPVKAGNKSLIFRFVKSTSDLTPVSPDMPIDFSTPGEYWFSLGAQ